VDVQFSTACINPAYSPSVESSEVFGVQLEDPDDPEDAVVAVDEPVVVGADDLLELPQAAATSTTTASPKTHRDRFKLCFIHSPCLCGIP
jgi:hypothetical protein